MLCLTDMHHHILFGMDDGPEIEAEMEQMLTEAQQAGVTTIVATPHITPGIVPFSMALLEQRVTQANRACERLGLNLRVLMGSEMLYTFQTGRYLAEKRVPTLAGTNRVLVEFDPQVQFFEINDAIATILCNGYVPVLAHVERYSCLMWHPRRTIRLRKQKQVLYQLNESAILKSGLSFAAFTVRRLLRNGMQDNWPEKLWILIVGDGNYRQSFENIINSTAIASRVVLTGPTNNVVQMLSASDFFIMPSLHENHSIALLEALAIGLP